VIYLFTKRLADRSRNSKLIVFTAQSLPQQKNTNLTAGQQIIVKHDACVKDMHWKYTNYNCVCDDHF